MIKATLQPMTLVLWEARELPKSEKVGDKWVKTGEKEAFTLYTFRDEFGDVLKFLQRGEGLRHLEHSDVQITLAIEFDDYSNKNVMKLDSCVQLAS